MASACRQLPVTSGHCTQHQSSRGGCLKAPSLLRAWRGQETAGMQHPPGCKRLLPCGIGVRPTGGWSRQCICNWFSPWSSEAEIRRCYSTCLQNREQRQNARHRVQSCCMQAAAQLPCQLPPHWYGIDASPDTRAPFIVFSLQQSTNCFSLSWLSSHSEQAFFSHSGKKKKHNQTK